MDGVWKQIGAIADENSGIITTAQVEAAGISRTALKLSLIHIFLFVLRIQTSFG